MQNKNDLLTLFTHHRVASNLLMVLIIVLGIWALNKLNTQFFPNFALDIVNVRTIWFGASAEDVEKSITKPLEQELFTLDNLHKISSTSATGVSAITLEFKEGTDIGIILDEINQRIQRFRQLPSDSEDTEITRVIRYENVARLLISQQQDRQNLRELSYEIRDQLLKKGIAKIDISGLPEQEIAIEIPTRALQSINKPLEVIANSIRQESRDTPAGFIGKNEVARQIRGLNQKYRVEEFQNIEISTAENDDKIKLDTIAEIRQQNRDNQVELYYKNKPAVELRLLRTENSDAIASAKILENWIEQNVDALPEGIELTVFDQSWKLINERISVLLFNGLGGLLLVIGILYLFLNGRAAFWVSAGIPVSFMATLIILYLAGSSINMISLFGLIMAVGIIVDDAIVVAEHTQTKFDNGLDAGSAAEQGARRMLAPVVSSSLTTISAFLPMMLIGGIMGKIMFEIPLVIICVVLASLFECFLILPAHMRFTFLRAKHKTSSRFRTKMDKTFAQFQNEIFHPMLQSAVKNRQITLILSISILILSIGLVAGGRISYTFFPTTESQIIYANVSFTAGTPKENVTQFLQHMESTVYETNEQLGGGLLETAVIRQGSSSSGDGRGTRTGDQYGSLFVELISPDQRNVRNPEFIKQWKQNINPAPGIELFTIAQRMGGPPGQDVDIRLTGNTPEILKIASEALQAKLTSYPGISAVEDDLPWGQEQLIYQLTPQGKRLGLSVEEVGKQLRNAFDGILIQVFQQENDEIEVRVRLPRAERNKITDLNKFLFYLPNGSFVPLKSVISVKSRKGFDALRHSQTQLTVRVSANVDNTINNANRILDDLSNTFLPTLEEKYDLRYFYEGRASEQKETMEDMKFGSNVALLLIFIILAWVFKSYSKPLVVMAAIPFGICGALFGHYLMGIELTILSLFGLLGLSGIVVNDSIILVTVYQELREQGVEIKEAIEKAATSRLRAVLLTSLTTIAGLTPLLFEGSVQAQFLIPMAVSITFGLAFGTFLVLFVVPVLISYVESLRTLLLNLFKSRRINHKIS